MGDKRQKCWGTFSVPVSNMSIQAYAGARHVVFACIGYKHISRVGVNGHYWSGVPSSPIHQEP